MTLAIITDSTSYLNREFIEENNITVMPLMVNFPDQSYKEIEELGVREFYEKMEASDELPTSSQPSYGEVLEAMNELAQDHDQILGITLSSKLSGTYLSFSMAAQEIKNAEVKIIDSELTCRYLANYIKEAIRLDQAGYSLDEIVDSIESMKKDTEVIFSVSNLKNFRKSGRISNAASMLGDVFQIRPILELQDGEILATNQVRTDKRVIQYMLEAFDQAYQEKNGQIKAILLESFPGENPHVQNIKSILFDKYPDLTIEEDVIGPVIGSHTGPTVYALGWMRETGEPLTD